MKRGTPPIRALTLFLIAAAAMAASFAAAPQPAEAQAVIRLCVVNQAGMMIRSRFIYTTSRGARHMSDWAVNAQGQRHCGTLQDVRALSIEVEGHVGSWQQLNGCGREYFVSDPKKSADLFITGTSHGPSCTVQQ